MATTTMETSSTKAKDMITTEMEETPKDMAIKANHPNAKSAVNVWVSQLVQLVVPLAAVVVPFSTIVFATASDLMNFIYKY